MTKSSLKWNGKQLLTEQEKRAEKFLASFAGAVEQAAKQQLYPGHGVDTGSMQRGIHAASGDYDFTQDHSYPNGPERGNMGAGVVVTKTGRRLYVSVGSGQRYSLYQEVGTDHGVPALHYITNGFIRTRTLLGSFVRRGWS